MHLPPTLSFSFFLTPNPFVVHGFPTAPDSARQRYRHQVDEDNEQERGDFRVRG